MPKMKILVVSNCPLVQTQGSGYIIGGFCEGLRERGHEVDVLEPRDCEPALFMRKARTFRLALGMRVKLEEVLESKQYDVVELYGGETCLAAAWLHRNRDRRFLIVAHSNGIEMHASEVLQRELGTTSWNGYPRKWWQKLLRLPVRKAFSSADGIVTVSEYDREYALQNGLQPPNRVRAIPNSLRGSFLGRPLSLNRAPVIGFCGSWLARKGTRAIEEAIPHILGEFGDARVELIGVGAGFVKEKHFPRWVCPRIEVQPFVSEYEEMIRKYESLSILVMPSVYESFGLVSPEAMACGVALVATRTGFPSSLIDGEEALLLDRSVGGQLQAAVSRLLSDDPLRQRIARNGWKKVQDLRWDWAVEALERTYVQWLGEVRHEEWKAER